MKKIFMWMLLLCIILSFGGCAVAAEASTADAAVSDRTVVSGETWKLTENVHVAKLTLEPGALVEADHPVIVFYEESDTVENGQVIGQVQFVCEYDEVVAIVHTNDVHGFLDVEPYVKGLKTQLEQSGDYSLVLAVSNGDVYAGGYAAAHVYEGEYVNAVMSRVYDYMTWGNNDAGLTDGLVRTQLLSLLGEAAGMTTIVGNAVAVQDVDMAAYAEQYVPAIGIEEFVSLYPDVLSLNADGTIDWSALELENHSLSAGDVVLPAAAVTETALGTKIGIFGETTAAGPAGEDIPEISADLESISVAAQSVALLQSQGADVIVADCHTGWFSPVSTETSSNDTNSAQMILNVPGIDAFVDGHTHSVICEGEGWLFDNTESKTIVNQANCKGEAIGLMELYINDGVCIAKDCDNYTPDEYKQFIEPDAEVQAVVDQCYRRLADDGYTTVLVTSEHFLNGERLSSKDVGGGVRANETNLGDLVADGMIYAAQQTWDKDVQVSMYPGVRIRSSIPAGDVTMIDIMSVFSSPVVIYYDCFTARELVAELNSVINKVGKENTPFTQIGGMKLTYNSNKQVESLCVGDVLVYQSGEYLVGDEWTVGCVCCFSGGTADYEEEDIIFADSMETAWAFRDYLANGQYTILPNEVAPDGRIVPCEGYEELVSASSGMSEEPSNGPSDEPA